MGWSPLGTQFCLQLAFGVLLALAFVPRAPVGAMFYRLMATTALLPIALAIGMSLLAGSVRWSEPWVVLGSVSALAYPFYARVPRGRSWWVALALALGGVGAALVVCIAELAAPMGRLGILAGSLSALCTGAVAGSVGLAMVLGHWYLTVPKLEIAHLQRLNRLSVACMVLSLVLLGLTCAVQAGAPAAAGSPLATPRGLFHLGTRITVGLLLPLLFAWMAADSLRWRNTRSATGILYASTVLVLIGTGVAISLQDAYGVPL
ncbi:MAG TPA: hypothetical protein VMS76_09820 [Planctomycetota bacterium]|nr:hypothetical protein [Planctomycetota bacterium]